MMTGSASAAHLQRLRPTYISEQRMSEQTTAVEQKSFLQRHGDRLLLAGLYVYVVLLAIGVIAEAFDIQAILRLYP